jgi:hypothetical protein
VLRINGRRRARIFARRTRYDYLLALVSNARRFAVTLLTVAACMAGARRAGAQVTDDWYLYQSAPEARAALAPEPPPAPNSFETPPPPFGAPGEVVISGTSGLGASHTGYDGSNASVLSLSFGPAFDVFVARNVSLGLSGGASYGDSRGYGADGSLVETTSTSVSGAARVGVNLPLSGSLSFWPRLLLGFEWVHQSVQAVTGSTTSTAGSPLGYPTTTRSGPWGELVLPLTLQVSPHLFASVGPSVFQEISDAQGGPNVGGQRTTLGAFVEVGGWLGGRRDSPSDGAGEPAPAVGFRRFGSRGGIVITNAFVLQGFWTAYAGSGSTSAGISVSPALDYFVANHFSLGVAFSGSYYSGSGIDSTTGNQVTYSHGSYGAAVRIGGELPMGDSVSLWPIASLGFGGGSYDEAEGGSRNKYSNSSLSVSLYTPLLVHLASHFFVGLGPFVSHDLTNTITSASGLAGPENRSTTVGASLLVGGAF